MKEQDFLKNFAKILGAESAFAEIEEKRQREKLMLESLGARLGVHVQKEVEKDVPAILVEQPVVELEPIVEHVEVLPEPIVENVIPPLPQLPVDTIVTKSVDVISKAVDTQTAVDKIDDPIRRELDAMKKVITDLHRYARNTSQMGGGGEVNLRYLDDVKRDTIADGRWLKYSAIDKKFIFDDINPYQVVYNTTEVTTPTYTVSETDYYIGVNYAGPVTITLPASADSGRIVIIKDEDGDAETNPITVLGTVDNDAGGFIIQINNGAIQMIYRNGWRIV